ncbi:UNVERIFIED_CONTAM: hypothetical protein FKN15_052957 [Acipenser sinensis]
MVGPARTRKAHATEERTQTRQKQETQPPGKSLQTKFPSRPMPPKRNGQEPGGKSERLNHQGARDLQGETDKGKKEVGDLTTGEVVPTRLPPSTKPPQRNGQRQGEGDEGERKASPATAPARQTARAEHQDTAPTGRRLMSKRPSDRRSPGSNPGAASWLRSSSTHEPSDPPPRVVFVRVCVSRPPRRRPEPGQPKGAGKTVENQASKVLSSSQGGQALGGEDQLRIFHRERAGQSRSPATRAHRPQAGGTREATESLDLPPGGDRYLQPGFRGDSDRARAAGPPQEERSGGHRACRRRPSRLPREAPGGSGLRRAAAIPRPLPNPPASTRRARSLERNATGRWALLRDGWRARATRGAHLAVSRPGQGKGRREEGATERRPPAATPVPLRRSTGQRAAREEGPRAGHGRLRRPSPFSCSRPPRADGAG